jgi:tetrahydromethanopterin S-methyltransferase subunit C
VCGLLSLGFGPLASIPAVIAGHEALRQIRRTGDGGYGLAKAGLILGYITLALMAVAVLLADIGMITNAVQG